MGKVREREEKMGFNFKILTLMSQHRFGILQHAIGNLSLNKLFMSRHNGSMPRHVALRFLTDE